MAVGRRGFLASLLGVLVVPSLASFPNTRGIEHFIRANVWDVGRPLTEREFTQFLAASFCLSHGRDVEHVLLFGRRNTVYFSRIHNPEHFEVETWL